MFVTRNILNSQVTNSKCFQVPVYRTEQYKHYWLEPAGGRYSWCSIMWSIPEPLSHCPFLLIDLLSLTITVFIDSPIPSIIDSQYSVISIVIDCHIYRHHCITNNAHLRRKTPYATVAWSSTQTQSFWKAFQYVIGSPSCSRLLLSNFKAKFWTLTGKFENMIQRLIGLEHSQQSHYGVREQSIKWMCIMYKLNRMIRLKYGVCTFQNGCWPPSWFYPTGNGAVRVGFHSRWREWVMRCRVFTVVWISPSVW